MLRDGLDKLRRNFFRVAIFIDQKRWIFRAIFAGWDGGGADKIDTFTRSGDGFAMFIHFVHEMDGLGIA